VQEVGVSWNLTDAKNPQQTELDKLFNAAKKAGQRAYLIVVLAYNAALRVSELVHARVPDFNWTTGKMTLIPAKKAGRRRIKQPDGTLKIVERPLPKPVEYPLPQSTMKIVQQYIEEAGLPEDSWLFPGDVSADGCHLMKRQCPGGHLSKRMAQKIWDAICTKAGVKVAGRGIHSLKHARLTEVAEKSHDPFLVKAMGRHSTIAMSDHYVKYVELREKTDKIGGRE
jgi:integrase